MMQTSAKVPKAMKTTRRQLLGFAVAGVPVAIALGAAGARAACLDPATLPLSQKNRRRSLGYVEAATDPARRCQGCAFFTPATDGCGKCQMLDATVNAGATCNSFVPRPK